MPPPPYLGRARLGNRLNAFRLNHFDVNCVVSVAGTVRSIHKGSLVIRDVRGAAPNTATFDTVINPGWTPLRGQEIKIGLGALSNLFFAGQIEGVDQTYESKFANVVYKVTCTDYTRLLNRRKVWATFDAQDAATATISLLQTYTSGFTDLSKIEAGVGDIPVLHFEGADVTECLDEFAKASGAVWFVDYRRRVRLEAASSDVRPTTITESHPTARNFTYTRQLRQARTRVYVLGAKTSAPVLTPAGSTSLPVESLERLPSSGTVIVGTAALTYAGTSQTATPSGISDSPAAPTATLDAVAGGIVGSVSYRVSIVGPDGESVPGAVSNSVTGVALASPSAAPTPAEAHSASTVSVSSITRSGTTATVTTGSAHGYTMGMYVTIAGAVQSQYNGTFQIVAVGSTTTFTYRVVGAPASPATGTITAQAKTPGPLIGTYRYRYTYVDARGETVASSDASVTATEIAVPGTPSATVSTTVDGGIPAGAYVYGVAFGSASGQTAPGNGTTATVSAVSAPGALTPDFTTTGPGPNSTTASSLTRSGDVATFNTISAHGLTVGMRVRISGAIETAYNGIVTVATVVDSDTFTYEVLGSPSSPATTGSAIYVLRMDGRIEPGARTYKVVYESASGGVTALGTASGTVTVTAVSDASGPTATASPAATGVAPGTYRYVTTFVTAEGETMMASYDEEAVGATSQVALTNIAVSSDSRVVGRNLYRTRAGGSAYYLLGSIADNTTTTFTDTLTDAQLGPGAPWRNTTGGQVSLTGIGTSGDARITKRTIYRTKAGGTTYFRLATINDNTTTTYTDRLSDDELTETYDDENQIGGQIALSSIPTSADPRVTHRIIYRSKANLSDLYILTTLQDNTTTTYTDNAEDENLSVSAPEEGIQHGAAIKLTGIGVSGDARVAGRRIYRTVAGGSEFRLLATLGDNTGTTYTDYTIDADLGEAQIAGTVVLGQRVTLTNVALGPSGTTARNVWRTTGGGSVYRFVGSIADNTTTTFVDTNADVELGQPLKVGGYLTGVTLAVGVEPGAAVRLRVMREDVAAQAALAALEGGDGIHEHLIDAGELATKEECERKGDAELEDFDAGEDNFTWRSRDTNTGSNRLVTINVGAPHSISAEMVIQDVTWTGFEAAYLTVNGVRIPTFPMADVAAGRTRLTLEDLLRMIPG